MIHTRKHWLRASLAMLLAVCMFVGIPTVALADTSTVACVNEEAAKDAVATAVNYCSLAQDIIDMIVDMVIDDPTYSSILEQSKNSADLKNAAIDIIKSKISDDMIRQAGMEPTDKNRTLLSTEVYDVAIMYYDHVKGNDTTATRAEANKKCMKEILRFALVTVKSYSEKNAVETAEFYYELNQINATKGQAAAIEEAKKELGGAHTFGEPTWTWAEDKKSATAAFKCTACGHTQSVKATITEKTTAATCDKAGSTVYTATATLDSTTKTSTQTVSIPATGHSYGAVTWKWAEDYATATASKTCSKCGDVKSANATITSEISKATCEQEGTAVYTAKATLDGAEVTDVKNVTLPAGHLYTATWTWEGYTKATAALKCSVCEKETTANGTITSKTEAATCDKAGTTTYTATATVEGKTFTDTKTESIPAKGHTYGDATWTWADDFSKATVSKTCSVCKNVISANGAITKATTTEATCEKNGTVTYTAKATLDGTEFTSTKTQTVPAGHKFVNGKCSVCGMTMARRIFGDNRYETAFKVADQLKEVLGVAKFDTIIVASGTEFADALSGSYLAAVKKAPILLTNKFNIENVQKYIADNLAANGTVYILGGEAAVSKDFEDGLVVKPTRLSGTNRYMTNLSILKEAGVEKNQEILVCTGTEFADSLSASAAGKPILMVKKEMLDAQKEFLNALGGAKFVIVGGTGAVAASAETALKAYGTVERINGENRYETSTKLAERFYPDAEAAVLAYGKNFPDGLCGGVLAYCMDAPLILTYDGRADFTADYTNDAGISSGIVLGGTGLISDASVRSILDLAKDTVIPVI